jgi:group I intron endonuclease
MKQSGIYAIENTVNGKRYYGSTKDKAGRWQHHKWHLRNGKHGNAHLQMAWNKYGETAFRFIWLKDVPNEQLLDVEQKYIDTNVRGRDICCGFRDS